MNNCELYQELISRLVDGELSRDEYAALEAHMENCAECSAMYAVFASLSDIIGGEDEPLPEDLHENIMAGVRRSAMINHNRRRLSKPVRNVLAAAACAALVLFASRGLAPEKAASNAISQEQAAAMDVQVQQPESAPAEAAASAMPAPAVSAAPAATVSEKPVATPQPTRDIYLNDENNEAKPAKNSTDYSQNYVLVTPKPTEIRVDTPVTQNTPKPAPAVTENTTAATAAPATPEPAAQTETPAAQTAQPEPAAGSAHEEAAPLMTAAEENEEGAQPAHEAEELLPGSTEESAQPVPAADNGLAAKEEAAAAEPEETPSASKRLFSFFSMPRPEAVAEPQGMQENEGDTLPTEAAAAGPLALTEESAAPVEESEETEEEENLIKLDSVEKLTELENMLDGEEAELPEEDALEEYSFTLREPEEGFEDYLIRVLVYEDEIYYVQYFAEDDFISCLAPCEVEDFEKFMDSLSDEEKGIVPSPSPVASAEPAVTESPAPESSEAPAEQETELPAEQSPEISE